MIKINLLPHSKRAKVSETEKQIILFFLLMVFFVAGIAGVGAMAGVKASELEEVAREKQAQRQLLLGRVARYNEMQKQFEEARSNVAAIREIRLRQQLPVRYVDEAVQSLPEERIWFEAFNLSAQGVMDIRGVALDNQAFAGYVDELRKSPYVRSVSTQRTSSRQVMNLDLVEFQFQVRAGPAVSRQDD